jgi:rhodanese-related sulfurtransferase
MPYSAQDLVAQARAVIEEIDPVRLRALQAAGTPVIDVRESDEFAEGHLPGGVNISGATESVSP